MMSKQDYEHMALAGEYEIGFRGEAELCVISNDMIDVSLWPAWNPDTDLADNYRLAIDAGIEIDCDDDEERMKAVCDCAIEIGKTMGVNDE